MDTNEIRVVFAELVAFNAVFNVFVALSRIHSSWFNDDIEFKTPIIWRFY